MRDIPKEHEIYRHFKGNVYEVLTVARHTETLEELVIYRDMHDHSRVFARPMAMFMSEVDHMKYPDVSERFRFTRVEGKVDITPMPEPDEVADVSPALIRFLDADSYEEKLDILIRMKAQIDDEMINAMAVSLDTEINAGTTEERFAELKACLITMEKYECNRLR